MADEYLEVNDEEVVDAAVQKYLDENLEEVADGAIEKYMSDNEEDVADRAAVRYLEEHKKDVAAAVLEDMPFEELKKVYKRAKREEAQRRATEAKRARKA